MLLSETVVREREGALRTAPSEMQEKVLSRVGGRCKAKRATAPWPVPGTAGTLWRIKPSAQRKECWGMKSEKRGKQAPDHIRAHRPRWRLWILFSV